MSTSDPRGGRVEDPRVLRAIAHPVRQRVLAELYAAGPLRAADVAAAIDIPANQASFHLRQLAKYGLVEEAPELARDGRDRVWRPTEEHGINVSLEELEESPGGRAAVSVFRRQAAATAHVLVDRAFAEQTEEGVHVMVGDTSLRLTKGEAVEFSQALTALVEEWRLRGVDGPEQRRTYQLLQVLQPAGSGGAGAARDGA